MKYELIAGSNRGVGDHRSVYGDIRSTWEVLFLLPESGSDYIALFKGIDGIERKAVIKDGKCDFPREIIKQGKEQWVQLRVCRSDGEKILWTWECDPLRLTAYNYMRANQWELSGGMTEENLFNRVIELERLYGQAVKEMTELKETFKAQTAEQNAGQQAIIRDLKSRIEALETAARKFDELI